MPISCSRISPVLSKTRRPSIRTNQRRPCEKLDEGSGAPRPRRPSAAKPSLKCCNASINENLVGSLRRSGWPRYLCAEPES